VAKPKSTINLLPKTDLEKSPIGKFLKWALNFGRYIIIVTELIVILTFLFRFKLDMDLAKAKESINKNQAIITSYKKLENNVKHLQQRLKYINKIEQQGLFPSSILDELSKITPIDIIFSSLNISNNRISIKGKSLSKVGLNTFLYGLQSSEKFTQLDLESISSKGKQNPTIDFELSVNLKTK